MNSLRELRDHGQSYWLDNLTRRMLENGELERRVREEGLGGVTSNPTIFDHAIEGSEDYDAQIREAAAAGRSTREIYRDLVVADVQRACDVLRPRYDETDGADGFVSLEVSPHLAHDTEASIREAQLLFRRVDRPNVLIKIPGTAAGVPAIEECLFEGINVNVTLLFAIGSYEAVANAYLRALERRAAAGRPVRRVASVASFFLSRIDVLVDQLLSHHFSAETTSSDLARSLLGKAAVANAKLAYQQFKRFLESQRWQALAQQGARPQRVLWASTSTKNPAYSDVKYVEPLIGPHTVNTMPEATIAAFADHGQVGDTLEEGLVEAQQVMQDLRRAGIAFEQVTWQLENEGVEKFIEPYDHLLARLEAKRERFAGRAPR